MVRDASLLLLGVPESISWGWGLGIPNPLHGYPMKVAGYTNQAIFLDGLIFVQVAHTHTPHSHSCCFLTGDRLVKT